MNRICVQRTQNLTLNVFSRAVAFYILEKFNLWMHSFGIIRINITDPKSLGSGCIILALGEFIGSFDTPWSNRPFAAFHSRGTKPPCWDAKVALWQDEQRKWPFKIMYAFCCSCPSATFASQHGGFVPHERKAAKGYWSRITNRKPDPRFQKKHTSISRKIEL